jgi:hypothetical protein
LFFNLARISHAPIVSEAVTRIDTLFEINGPPPPPRVGVRTERRRRLVVVFETWLREQRVRVSENSDTGKAIDHSLRRWAALIRFLNEGLSMPRRTGKPPTGRREPSSTICAPCRASLRS